MRPYLAALFFVCVLVGADVRALEPSTEREAPRETEATTDRQDTVDSKQEASTPTTTFTPSEKIEADSAVAFPVDI